MKEPTMFEKLLTSWLVKLCHDITKASLGHLTSKNQKLQYLLTEFKINKLEKEFQSIYTHTLVEYSINKDKRLVFLFGLRDVSDLFDKLDKEQISKEFLIEELVKIILLYI